MILDDFFSGFQLTYGDKFKAKLEGGRWGKLSSDSDYWGLELLYNDKNRFNIGAGYKFGGDVKLEADFAKRTFFGRVSFFF